MWGPGMTPQLQSDRWIRARLLLDTLASVAMLAAAGAILFAVFGRSSADAPPRETTPQRSPPAIATISFAGAPFKGNPNAPVAVLMFSDFACGFCAGFVRAVLPNIERDYIAPGKVRFGFKHFPVVMSSGFSIRAAEAAMCAGRQGRFWEMHDRLFQAPSRSAAERHLDASHLVDLNAAGYRECLAAGNNKDVLADIAQAKTLNVRGTPTFFLGVVERESQVKVLRRITGVPPPERFRTALDFVLGAAGKT
jgi:protein-disulfide isomerase